MRGMPEVPLKRARLRAYVSAIADLMGERESGRNMDRGLAIEVLRKALEEFKVEPFRGVRFSEDIYDKEIMSLFIVAKYILRIPVTLFGEVFTNEILLDRTSLVIRNSNDSKEVRTTVEKYLGTADEVTLSKLIRYIATEYYLDLIGEESAFRSVKNLINAFPEYSENFKRMCKFFMAVILGSKIASGEIKSKIDLEIRKKALAINLGLSGGAPSNEYVIEVAKLAYGSAGTLAIQKTKSGPYS
jgi:hypothetical protein